MNVKDIVYCVARVPASVMKVEVIQIGLMTYPNGAQKPRIRGKVLCLVNQDGTERENREFPSEVNIQGATTFDNWEDAWKLALRE